ncbi:MULTISPECIES: AAA family ATPase [Pseudonocardia]|uniref:AAA family ATPase n=1 Tax=Pseudonocardia TaxID=1847 RepID=UPI001AD60D32|nr:MULTISPECIES: AAA family ATPase [Pseudonocardia]MBO4238092.1 AAA family ATPase [Pseudonocardia alni]
MSLDPAAPSRGYPFELPVVRWLREHGGLALYPGVTFLVGENGSGKSTLVEAVAVAVGLNPEGGSRSFRFATRASESDLGSHLRVARRPGRERTSFFLRAESYYNVASEVERLDREPGGPPLLPAYGGSGHERSHGESFLALLRHRFFPRGLYLLDEPEAALSVTGALAVLARMTDLTARGSQFVVATHSPVLLALPGATILEIGDDGAVRRVGYDEALPVVLTRSFLADPDAFLRHL